VLAPSLGMLIIFRSGPELGFVLVYRFAEGPVIVRRIDRALATDDEGPAGNDPD
jgi:hypothetical protein